MVQRCDPAARGVQGLVLVPTRELAIQVGEVMSMLAEPLRVDVTLLYGGRPLERERRALLHAQVVVGTPGRILDHLQQGTLSLRGVRTLVLDEADEMLDKGFGPPVAKIISHCPADRQTALFSATLPEWVRTAADRYLRQPVTVKVDPAETPPPEIEHIVYDVPQEHRFDALRTLLSRQGPDPIIVFGRTKHGVKKLARQLQAVAYSVGALQGNMSQAARERVMSDFRAGNVRVLVATNVAARGLDIEAVEQVINYELPETAELFTHRVGRTGRMGRSGEAITFLTPEDAGKWREFERTLRRRFPRKPWPITGEPRPTPALAPVIRQAQTPRRAQPAQRPLQRTAAPPRPQAQRPQPRIAAPPHPRPAQRAAAAPAQLRERPTPQSGGQRPAPGAAPAQPQRRWRWRRPQRGTSQGA